MNIKDHFKFCTVVSKVLFFAGNPVYKSKDNCFTTRGLNVFTLILKIFYYTIWARLQNYSASTILLFIPVYAIIKLCTNKFISELNYTIASLKL